MLIFLPYLFYQRSFHFSYFKAVSHHGMPWLLTNRSNVVKLVLYWSGGENCVSGMHGGRTFYVQEAIERQEH